MKYKRSVLRFVLAAILLVTGILMLDNLLAGLFVLFVALYALVSGILWLRVDMRQNGGDGGTPRDRRGGR
ncbi:hypothetical protein [Saccharibacillus alkalitolerans]|uniref:DUF2892 domain-containing protein n=1 Tax=Saccharibacillus alkalitolerans TaxID=2705290 RepID=A0ABX0F6A4_9BACL|nr:hypothetical protein [Saccharibacillus alkalitolerans]NGZ76492.1 hypothetical protein [Saccharibacillus alkalitolerans]